MIASSKEEPLNLWLSDFNQIGVKFIIAMIVLVGSIVLISIYNDVELYALGAIVGSLVIYFLFKFPKIWIYSVVLLQITFIRENSKGLSVSEVLTAIIFSIGLLIWFIDKLFINKEKIVNDIGDWIILFFMVALLLNFATALSYGVTALDWFREYNLYAYLLYYFPIKSIIKSTDELKKLLAFSMAVLFVIEIIHFLDFYLRIRSNLVYAYQFGRSLQRSQTTFVTAGIFFITFTFFQKNAIKKYLFLFMSALTVSALISTFSRTFWVYFILAIGFVFLYLPFKKKILLLVYVSVIGFFVVAGFYFAAGDKIAYMAKIYITRLTSTSKGTKDISMQARFSEWQAVLNQISEYPLGGTGLKSQFSYYDILTQSTLKNDIVHNGYFWAAYRIGIPLTILFFLFLLYKSFKSLILFINLKDKFYRNMMFCTIISFSSIIVSNTISNQIVQRDCIFTLVFLFSFISFAQKQLKSEKVLLQQNSI